MQLLLALALLLVATNAQTPGYIVNYWYAPQDPSECWCNGTFHKVVGTWTADLASDCTATPADMCDGSSGCAGPKRSVDVTSDFRIACMNSVMSQNDGVAPDTFAGWLVYGNDTCTDDVASWTEYRIGTCIEDESPDAPDNTNMWSCLPAGSTQLANYTTDEFCNETSPVTTTEYTQTCTEMKVSTCTLVTEAPTEAPVAAPEAGNPTDPPTDAPPAWDIYTVKQLCRDETLRTAFELEITNAAALASGVAALCTISNCNDILLYTAAEFRYECRVEGDARYDPTTGADVCPAVLTVVNQYLPVGAGSLCVDEVINTENVRARVTMGPLAASGSLLSTSFFMLVALILANLF